MNKSHLWFPYKNNVFKKKKIINQQLKLKQGYTVVIMSLSSLKDSTSKYKTDVICWEPRGYVKLSWLTILKIKKNWLTSTFQSTCIAITNLEWKLSRFELNQKITRKSYHISVYSNSQTVIECQYSTPSSSASIPEVMNLLFLPIMAG